MKSMEPPFCWSRESRGFVKSPSPAIILSIPVKNGDKVKKGDVLIVLEAMKMEMLIEAPSDGVIAEILYGPGAQVAAGQPLIRLDEGEEEKVPEEDSPAEVRIVFPASEQR